MGESGAGSSQTATRSTTLDSGSQAGMTTWYVHPISRTCFISSIYVIRLGKLLFPRTY